MTSPDDAKLAPPRPSDRSSSTNAQRGRPTRTSPDRPQSRYEGSGVAAGVVALLVAATLVVVVVAQNTEDVPFEFLWWGVDVPLAVLLLATALTVIAVDQVVGLVWRRRRRRFRELAESS